MPYIMVDIEADGPCPGLYSMLSLGAVIVEQSLNTKFYQTFRPISESWNEQAISVGAFTREQTLTFPPAEEGMTAFHSWVKDAAGDGRPIFVSDNNGFDWQFVNYYFHQFCGENPFGHSSMNLGSFYKGLKKDLRANFKHLRKTKHTHNALEDAIGNAEAMLEIINEIRI